MNISISFIRSLFLVISVLFWTAYTTSLSPENFKLLNLVLGLVFGGLFWLAMIGSENLFKKFNLRSFNIAALGLFFGYLMAQAIWSIFLSILSIGPNQLTAEVAEPVKIIIFLFSAYLGMVMTARAAEELHVSIPFVKFKPTTQKKKDIIIDASIFGDLRIIDLATSGLLDHHLIIPRFIIKDLTTQSESTDENVRTKAKKCLEVLKKLEAVGTLDPKYSDSDFPEIKDQIGKLIRLARLLDANIMTADMDKIQQSGVEGIRIISMRSLTNALKPITQTGEFIHIKIQRYGKEPRQGVGYLEDGTMVVVNGGAEYIGEMIKAQVLSVKHTSSGRMIFCNALEDEMGRPTNQDYSVTNDNVEDLTKNFFALGTDDLRIRE